MNLRKGFDLTKRYYPLIFVPIILDLLLVGDILRRVQGFTFKLTIPSAVPSITEVLADQPQTGSGFLVNLPYGYLGGVSVFIFVFFILASIFLKGGFLGCVFTGINEQKISVDIFIDSAIEYFSRFLLQFLINTILLVITIPFFFTLGALGLIVFTGIMILFFCLIFWDYIIVAENATLLDAAKTSFNLVQSNIGKVLYFVVPIALITALFGMIANAVIAASPFFAVIVIVIYAYYGTAVVFAMMSFYLESLRDMD